MPADHRLRLEDREGGPPPRPQPGEPDPEDPVPAADLRPGGGVFEHAQLLPEDEILHDQPPLVRQQPPDEKEERPEDGHGGPAVRIGGWRRTGRASTAEGYPKSEESGYRQPGSGKG